MCENRIFEEWNKTVGNCNIVKIMLFTLDKNNWFIPNMSYLEISDEFY